MYFTLKAKLLSTGYFEDNTYFHKYLNLICDNQQTLYDADIMQEHHILPRSYYEITGLRIDNSTDNLVSLLYKDHVLAHYFLAQCTTGLLLKAMCNAFMMLTNFSMPEEQELIKNLDNYQMLYEQTAKFRKGIEPPNKGKAMSAEQRAKISKSLQGHKVSAETRKRQSEAQKNMSAEKRANISAASKARNFHFSEEQRKYKSIKAMGHIVSEETRAKISAARKQKQMTFKWITNGIINKQLFNNEELPEGFYFGRTFKKKEEEKNGKA